MPDPFLVMATQNPIENEGVYPLPEAQRDRFLFKLLVGYPEPDEEREIVYRMGVVPPVANQVLPIADLFGCNRLRRTSSSTTRWSTTSSGWSSPRAPRREHGLTEVAGWLSYGASPARVARHHRRGPRAGPGPRAGLRGAAGRHRRRAGRVAAPPGVCPTTRWPTASRSVIRGRRLQAIPLPQVSPYTHPGSPDGQSARRSAVRDDRSAGADPASPG